jgi:hypothetical protein
MRDSMQQAASSFETSVKSELNKTETDLNKSVEALVADKPADAQPAAKPEDQPPVEAKPQDSRAG